MLQTLYVIHPLTQTDKKKTSSSASGGQVGMLTIFILLINKQIINQLLCFICIKKKRLLLGGSARCGKLAGRLCMVKITTETYILSYKYNKYKDR